MRIPHTQLKTLTILLLWNLCLSSNVVRNKRRNLDVTVNDDVDSDNLNSNLDNVYNNLKVKRSSNATKDLETGYLLQNTSKVKKQDNRTDNYGKANEKEEDTTEDYGIYNFTSDGCVGFREYCNMTEQEYMDMLNDYIFPHPYEWVLIATHAIVFVIGLIGNALVCIAVYRNHSMRTVTNYFIVNLAVADFMVILICLPPTVLWDVTETWFFGTAMCRIVLYLQVSEILLTITL